MISENVFLKQQDTLTWFWLLHHFACRSICVQEGQSRGTCKKASESSKAQLDVKQRIDGVENGTDQAFGDEFRWEEYVAGTYIGSQGNLSKTTGNRSLKCQKNVLLKSKGTELHTTEEAQSWAVVHIRIMPKLDLALI